MRFAVFDKKSVIGIWDTQTKQQNKKKQNKKS